MARLNQTQRKAMIRAFGIANALFELSGQDFGGTPDNLREKATFVSAHDLFIAGVEAARTSRALTTRERKSGTFMAGYRLTERGVSPTAATEGAVIRASNEPAPTKPPFVIADDVRARWSDPHWVVRTGDVVELFEKRKSEWVAVARKNTPPCTESPDWHTSMFEDTEWLSGPNVKDPAVVQDFAEHLFDLALEGDESVFEPNAEDHSHVARLRAQIASGRAAFIGEEAQPAEGGPAWTAGYSLAERFDKRSA